MLKMLRNGLRFYGDDEALPEIDLPDNITLKTFCLKQLPGQRSRACVDGAAEIMRRLSQNQRISINGLSERRKGILKALGVEDLEAMLKKEGVFFFLEDEQQRSLGNLYLNRTGRVVDKARSDLNKLGFDIGATNLADVGGFLVQDAKTLSSARIKREVVIEQLFLALQHYVGKSAARVDHLIVEVANGNAPMQRVMKTAIDRSEVKIPVYENVESPKFPKQLCQRTVLQRKPDALKKTNL